MYLLDADIRLVPFATNLQFQVLSCPSKSGRSILRRQEAGTETESGAGPDTDSETIDDDGVGESSDGDEESTAGSASSTLSKDRYIRLILNDAVVPLTGIRDCPEHDEGLCPLDGFVGSLQEIVRGVDFVGDCGIRAPVEF